VGNATGLGMAPFLITHPRLLDRWIRVRECALARARAQPQASPGQRARFAVLLDRARRHVAQWHTGDRRQAARIEVLGRELKALARRCAGPGAEPLAGAQPFDALFRSIEGRVSLETEELVASLLVELSGPLVDELENETGCDEEEHTCPAMTVGELLALIERCYGWTLQVDFRDPACRHLFWYVSAEKEEPRLGERGIDDGEQWELRIDVARQVQSLYRALAAAGAGVRRQRVAEFLLREPAWRGIVRRVQALAPLPYAEIRANLLDAGCVAVDMLRCKLATFGATGFDPRSDRWTRITLFQGAPCADALDPEVADDWWMPVMPRAPA